eukprot:tig00021036_g17283.t1
MCADNVRFASLVGRGPINAVWGEMGGVDLGRSALVRVVLRATVAPDDIADTNLSGNKGALQCRSLASGPGFNATVFMSFNYSTTPYEPYAEFVALLLIPTAEGIDLPGLQALPWGLPFYEKASVAAIPSWNVGDRYACTARFLRRPAEGGFGADTPGTVSGPSAPSLILRVTRSYDDIVGSDDCLAPPEDSGELLPSTCTVAVVEERTGANV